MGVELAAWVAPRSGLRRDRGPKRRVADAAEATAIYEDGGVNNGYTTWDSLDTYRRFDQRAKAMAHKDSGRPIVELRLANGVEGIGEAATLGGSGKIARRMASRYRARIIDRRPPDRRSHPGQVALFQLRRQGRATTVHSWGADALKFTLIRAANRCGPIIELDWAHRQSLVLGTPNDCGRRLAAESDSVIANDVDAHGWGLLFASAQGRQ
jgi:hypothetical protein